MPSGGSGAQLVDVTLAEGQVLADSDFGWHYFLSSDRTPTPNVGVPTLAPGATLSIATPRATLQLFQPTLEWVQPTQPIVLPQPTIIFIPYKTPTSPYQ